MVFFVRMVIVTRNNITIMRADAYIKIGLPQLCDTKTPSLGVRTDRNMKLRKFYAKLTVDENEHMLPVNIVSDVLTRYPLLIGKDFLDDTDVNVKRVEATSTPLDKDNNTFVKVCQVKLTSEHKNSTITIYLMPTIICIKKYDRCSWKTTIQSKYAK